MELGREAHLKLKREAAKLPAKNRKKAELVEALLRNESIEQRKVKTIRYQSLESALAKLKVNKKDQEQS